MNLQVDDAAAAPPADAWPRLSAEDRFARVVEAAPTALVLTAGTGRIEMVNQQAERMFGYSRAELQDKPLEMLMPKRFRHGHVGLREGFLAKMSPRIMGDGWDLFGLRKDGSEFPLEIGLNPIELDGQLMVLAGIVDVTARHEIAREKERQRNELERSNADLEEFAYVASHDLKAPLRGIAHLAQWITEDIGSAASAETTENLKLLQGRVLRLQSLLDGLLAYSRIGHTHTPAEVVDIGELVRDVTALLAPTAGFEVAFEGDVSKILTHRMPIHVVLENLIGNALKHHDRAAGRITVSARQVETSVEFRITDDGPGILPQFQERVFQIFQTLASRDQTESSGIGLAIVKRKVQGHGGRIWIESAPPARGTSFVFTWKEAAA